MTVLQMWHYDTNSSKAGEFFWLVFFIGNLCVLVFIMWVHYILFLQFLLSLEHHVYGKVFEIEVQLLYSTLFPPH